MRQKLVIKSSIIGIVAQIATVMISFICTRLFVRFIGLEAQGINGVVGNMLGLLQLSELGIGTAITYALYQPIVDKNEREICIVMRMFKNAYRIIGSIICVAGIGLSFFIDLFVESSRYSRQEVLVAYYILLISSVTTYFLAYKRNLLYADQKQYITTMIDMLCSVVFGVVKISCILVFKSYHVYLVVTILQTIAANIIVSVICDRHYPYLKQKVVGKYDKIEELKKNVLNLIIGKMGGFVYSSTDNMIISKFSGLAAVGYITNYKYIYTMLTGLLNSVTSPIQPMIGNYIREYKEVQRSYELFKAYTYIRFFLASIVTVGFVISADACITLWLGEEYLLPLLIVVLMSLDVFLGAMQGPAGEYMAVLGYFKYDKYMSLIGAGINLVTSIWLSKHIGIAGVLLGTVITQIFYWLTRVFIVYKNYFKRSPLEYVCLVMRCGICITVEMYILYQLKERFFTESVTIFSFLLLALLCLLTTAALNMLAFIGTRELAFLWSIMSKLPILRRICKERDKA